MQWLRKKLQHYLLIRKQRRQLLAMDENMRKDLGISRVDAEQFAGLFKTEQDSDATGRENRWKK